MKTKPLFVDASARWLNTPLRSVQPRSWLIETASLTARLVQRYPDFYVHPLRMEMQKPTCDTARLLKIVAHKRVQVREVLLYGNQQPVIFAQSILPRESLQGAWRGLSRLGNKPLGAVLFANPNVQRTPIRYKKLSPHHDLYRAAVQHLEVPPPELWARRSVFTLGRARILVAEVFLPALFGEQSA